MLPIALRCGDRCGQAADRPPYSSSAG
jgi:hypothetical protein